jgi:cytochrome P450
MIQQSVKGSSVAEVNAREIAQRLLILQLVAIYTTTFALANCLVNLYSSNSKNEYIDGLRSECSRVAADHDGLTSQTAIDRLYRTDSTVRESMRISPFDVVALFRHVSSVKSLDTGRGIVLPPNTRIGVPFQAIQHDERYFEHPLRFDAFRFSRMFEGPDGGGRRPDRDRELVVDISESFLAFGYGRHACPGRWYVSQTLKQSLVFFVQHYDVEMVAPTEKPKTLFNTVLPPLATEIRIRLRDAEC